MLKSVLAAASAVCVMGVAGASAAVIDFEGYAATTDTLYPSPLIEDGYQLIGNGAGNDYYVVGSTSSGYSGSTAVIPFGNETHTFSAIDGSAFNLVSIDLIENSWAQNIAGSVTFTGVFAGGGTIDQTFMTDGIFGPETFFFSGFSGLVSLVFTYTELDIYEDRPQIDNLVVEPVPVPAALPMFGAALAGIGWFRRRASRP
ncbi:hypothetical protein [Parvularcula sp. LCG005]|uniref:hypothetical protein n=1 Tax=Parvularcula sp. LCG005 TaxID=3078805 RepID=UPI002942290B|nr:hypothetical protein [Parvularcula sp. LCG005]WOI54332.1 hypothetical protein RUI03_04860 [Parvularcula sp. LCG005]